MINLFILACASIPVYDNKRTGSLYVILDSRVSVCTIDRGSGCHCLPPRTDHDLDHLYPNVQL